MTRVLLALAIAATALVSPAAGATPVKAALTVTSATPAVGTQWRWTVRTTAAGKPVKATVRIQIAFGSSVVGCWKGGKMQQCSGAKAGDPISSTGTVSKTIRWTAESRGVPLTFRALVTAGGKTRTLKTQITVR